MLRRLLETSKALKHSEITVLPAFGAVHAGHLACPDFDQIIGETSILDKRIKENYKLISGSNYEPFECSTLRDLLPEILLDIFQNSTDPSQLFEACGSHLDKSREVSLFMLGATSYLVLLRRSLHGQGFHVKLHSNSPSLPNSERLSKSRSVAIVGMSGTFPGSMDVDKLWESLMTRQEFHQKV